MNLDPQAEFLNSCENISASQDSGCLVAGLQITAHYLRSNLRAKITCSKQSAQNERLLRKEIIRVVSDLE